MAGCQTKARDLHIQQRWKYSAWLFFGVLCIWVCGAQAAGVIQVASNGQGNYAAIDAQGVLWTWASDQQVKAAHGSGTDVTRYVQASSGSKHVLAIQADGSLWGWGDNSNGALGVTALGKQVDQPVYLGAGFAKAVAWTSGSVALKSDGTLWAWGYVSSHPWVVNSPVPTQVDHGVADFSVGDRHGLLLKADSSVWAWGDNLWGQLGDGTNGSRFRPVKVGSGFAQVSAGVAHSMGVQRDGTLWAWGSNRAGQLGDGSMYWSSLTPIQVGQGFKQASAGKTLSLALKLDGSLWAFGSVYKRTLAGYSSPPESRLIHEQIGQGFSQLAPEGADLALKSDQTAWVFRQAAGMVGLAESGQLGLRGLPVLALPQGAGFADVSGEWVIDSSRNLRRRAVVNVAFPPTSLDWLEPDTVAGLRFAQISAPSPSRLLALQEDGWLWFWTWSGSDRSGPVSFTRLGQDFVQVSASESHFLAVKRDGSLWAWGNNYWGQVGDGTQETRELPIQIGQGFSKVSAASNFSLALGTDGSVWAWGHNAEGQLGDGTTTQRLRPVKVASQAVAISASRFHSLALKADGSLWAWGRNGYGELGTGLLGPELRPVQIGSGYAEVSAGSFGSLAIKSDGSLWAWGYNPAWLPQAFSAVPVEVGRGFVRVADGKRAVDQAGILWVPAEQALAPLADVDTPAGSPVQLAQEVSGGMVGWGSSQRLTLVAHWMPQAADQQRAGHKFLLAILPNGAILTFTPSGWLPFDEASPRAWAASQRADVNLVVKDFDASAYRGTAIFLGHGFGQSVAESYQDMLRTNRSTRVYLID